MRFFSFRKIVFSVTYLKPVIGYLQSQMADVFYINVTGTFKKHQVKVVREDVDMHFEKFTIHGKNKVVLKSNQKLLKLKGLKKWEPQYQVMEGEINSSHVLKEIIQGINEYLNLQQNVTGFRRQEFSRYRKPERET